MPFDPDAYVSDESQVAPNEVHSPATNQRIDMAMERFAHQEREAVHAAQREMDLMTEARTRFAKAQLYESILEGRLFEEDDHITLEVEAEFKAFAEERLRVLLGIETESHGKSGGKFEEEEVQVLKLFAAKMLGRPAAIPKPKEAAKPTLVTRAPVAQPVLPTATISPMRRGRGRPPGTGKNQRAAALSVQQQQALLLRQRADQLDAESDRMPRQDPPATNEMRTVTLPNGQKLVDKKPPVDPGLRPKPMPGPDEMVAIAMTQGEHGLRQTASDMGARPGEIITTKVTAEG